MLTVAELIRYRMAHERYVHRVGEALVDTRFGEFRLIAYESEVDGGESHVALIKGEISRGDVEQATRRCWSACTPTASWATYSVQQAASATRRSKARCAASRRKDAEL